MVFSASDVIRPYFPELHEGVMYGSGICWQILQRQKKSIRSSLLPLASISKTFAWMNVCLKTKFLSGPLLKSHRYPKMKRIMSPLFAELILLSEHWNR